MNKINPRGRYLVVLHDPEAPWDLSRSSVESAHSTAAAAERAMLALPRGKAERAAVYDASRDLIENSPVYGGRSDNPLPSSGWLWLGAAAALGLVAWLATRKKDGVAWTCAAGHECTKFKDGAWHDTDLVKKSLKIYYGPPDNFSELTKDYVNEGNVTYVLMKPAVMDGLPDVYGGLG